jgi:hypothetical protein
MEPLIRVLALIKRTRQPDARLHAIHHTPEIEFFLLHNAGTKLCFFCLISAHDKPVTPGFFAALADHKPSLKQGLE